MNQKPLRSGDVVSGVNWVHWSVVLCKPDSVERGLTDTVLQHLSVMDDVTILGRLDVTVEPWQVHVHYWDLLVDRDWFGDRDIPAALDDLYVGRTVTVALAYARRAFTPACAKRSVTSTRAQRSPAPSAANSAMTP